MKKMMLETECDRCGFRDSVDVREDSGWSIFTLRWDEADDPLEPWSNDRIAGQLVAFISEQLHLTTGHRAPGPDAPIEFWGYYADYDWVVTLPALRHDAPARGLADVLP